MKTTKYKKYRKLLRDKYGDDGELIFKEAVIYSIMKTIGLKKAIQILIRKTQ